MSIRLLLLIVAMVSILAVGAAFWNVPFVGPVISLASLFAVPGWLLTNVLFGNRTSPDIETRFILTFGFGLALVALESIALTLTGIGISRQSVTILGAMTNALLMGALILRRRTGDNDRGQIPRLNALPLSIIAIFVICTLVLFHQPTVQESYTEFYVIPRRFGSAEGYMSQVDLVISSHEEKSQTFRVFCEDARGAKILVAESMVEPESSFSVALAVPPPQPGLLEKMRLSVYRTEENVPYRWIELVGGGCERLQ